MRCSKCGQPMNGGDFQGHETAVWHTVCPPVPNEPSDSPKPSAIGDELDEQVDFILADQQETIGKVLLKKRILTFVEEQTKLARIDELYNVIKMEYQTNYDYIVQLSDVENRIAELEGKQDGKH